MRSAAPWIVGACHVRLGGYQLPDGRRPQLAPAAAPTEGLPHRRLSGAAVRRHLGPPPKLAENFLVDVITDISASMTGGNDVLGLRHEAVLILLEHLGARRKRVLGSLLGREGPSWHFQCRTFDNGGTCLDLGPLKVDSRALPRLRAALLGTTHGGSSVLGPALRASAEQAKGWHGRILRVVMSDFELYDRSVPEVLEEFSNTAADVNLAIVFGNQGGQGIDENRVRVRTVSPGTDSPAAVCGFVLDAIREICAEPWPGLNGSATIAPVEVGRETNQRR